MIDMAAWREWCKCTQDEQYDPRCDGELCVAHEESLDLLTKAAPDLLQAAELLEAAEDARGDCEECEGEGEPEACGACFPAFDDARVKRRLAIAKAKGHPTPSAGE